MIFFQERASENVVCNIPVILFRHHFVEYRHFSSWVNLPFKTSQQYHQTSNISCTLLGNDIIDHSDVVGAAPNCRCCSNYIPILNLTPGFNTLSKANCKTRRETFKYWHQVHLKLEVRRYPPFMHQSESSRHFHTKHDIWLWTFPMKAKLPGWAENGT